MAFLTSVRDDLNAFFPAKSSNEIVGLWNAYKKKKIIDFVIPWQLLLWNQKVRYDQLFPNPGPMWCYPVFVDQFINLREIGIKNIERWGTGGTIADLLRFQASIRLLIHFYFFYKIHSLGVVHLFRHYFGLFWNPTPHLSYWFIIWLPPYRPHIWCNKWIILFHLENIFQTYF